MATLQVAIDATRARAGAAQAQAAFGRVQAGAAGAATAATGLAGALNTAGGAAAAMARSFAPLLAVFGTFRLVSDAIGTMREFEQTMVTVRAVSGATGEEFERLSARARELGATTRFTAKEAGDAMLALSRAGFDATEAIDAVGATLNLAIAGAMGLEEATSITANAVRQFGLDASEAARATDVLLMTSNNANTNVEDLGEAMNYAAPVARSLGLEIEETAAIFGALADNGIKASMAGTAARGMMIRLLNPSEAARRSIEGMGLSLDEVNPAIVGFEQAMRNLAEGHSQLATRAEQSSAAAVIFGQRQVAAGNAILSSIDRLGELIELNEEATGTAGEMAHEMAQTLEGAFKSLRSAVEELFLSFGDTGLVGAMQDAVSFMTLVARALGGMRTGMHGVTPEAEAVANALRAIASALAALLALKIAMWFASFVRGLVAARLGVRALFTLIATNPIGALATAIGAVVFAIYQLRDETVTLGDTTASVGDWLTATWEVVGERIKLAFQAVWEAIKIVFNSILDTAKTIVNGVITAFVKMGEEIKYVFQDIGSWINGAVVNLEILAAKAADPINASRRQQATDRGVRIVSRLREEYREAARAAKAYEKAIPEMERMREEAFEDGRFVGDDFAEWQRSFDELSRPIEEAHRNMIALKGGIESNIENIRQYGFSQVADRLESDLDRDYEVRVRTSWDTDWLGGMMSGIGDIDLADALGLDMTSGMFGEIARRAEQIQRERAEAQRRAEEESRRAAAGAGGDSGAPGGDAMAAEALQRSRRVLAELDEQYAELSATVGMTADEIERWRIEQEYTEHAMAAFIDDAEAQEQAMGKLRQAFAQLDEAAARHEAYEERKRAEEEATRVREAALVSLREMGDALDEQFAVVGGTADEIARYRQELEIVEAANTAFGEGTREAAEAIEELQGKLNRVVEAQAAWNEQQRQQQEQDAGADAMRDMNEALDMRRQTLGMTSEAAARYRQEVQFSSAALAAYGGDAAAAARATDEFAAELAKMDRLEELRNIAQQVGTTLANAFTDMITGAKTFNEALEDVLQSLSRMAVQMATQAAMQAAIGGAFGGGFADGAAFRGGRVVPFATGGVVESPTMFPMAGGNTGLMGEAGPEAIMPLERGPNGRLGVRAAGGGGTVVNITVHATDAASFRRSERQIGDQIRRRLNESD